MIDSPSRVYLMNIVRVRDIQGQ